MIPSGPSSMSVTEYSLMPPVAVETMVVPIARFSSMLTESVIGLSSGKYSLRGAIFISTIAVALRSGVIRHNTWNEYEVAVS